MFHKDLYRSKNTKYESVEVMKYFPCQCIFFESSDSKKSKSYSNYLDRPCSTSGDTPNKTVSTDELSGWIKHLSRNYISTVQNSNFLGVRCYKYFLKKTNPKMKLRKLALLF